MSDFSNNFPERLRLTPEERQRVVGDPERPLGLEVEPIAGPLDVSNPYPPVIDSRESDLASRIAFKRYDKQLDGSSGDRASVGTDGSFFEPQNFGGLPPSDPHNAMIKKYDPYEGILKWDATSPRSHHFPENPMFDNLRQRDVADRIITITSQNLHTGKLADESLLKEISELKEKYFPPCSDPLDSQLLKAFYGFGKSVEVQKPRHATLAGLNDTDLETVAQMFDAFAYPRSTLAPEVPESFRTSVNRLAVTELTTEDLFQGIGGLFLKDSLKTIKNTDTLIAAGGDLEHHGTVTYQVQPLAEFEYRPDVDLAKVISLIREIKNPDKNTEAADEPKESVVLGTVDPTPEEKVLMDAGRYPLVEDDLEPTTKNQLQSLIDYLAQRPAGPADQR